MPDLLTSPSRGVRPPSRNRWLWASAAVLGLGASAVVFTIIERSSARPESRPVSAEVAGAAETASAPLPAEVAQAAAQKHTRVIATAMPPVARLFVDDVPLSSNPGSASFARDGQIHRIRAEAPGFVADAKTVIYDGDEQIVSFRLQRESHRTTSPRTPSGKPPVSTGVPPTSAPADLPAKGAPTKVAPPLDRDNPWSP
ncbi:MAG: hypothetical protein MUF34_04760 [Polyangiaceae bacterium]|nr:hypothetical protein [Polyangiaceae bacterium]